jgi:penicillin-binding protein 1B
VLVSAVWGVATVRELDRNLVERLSGRRWQLPSRLYGDSFVVYVGQELVPADLVVRLERLGYSRVDREPRSTGTYRFDRSRGRVDVWLREFVEGARHVPATAARLSFRLGLVTAIESLDDGRALGAAELEPELIAGIYDRIWENRRPVHVTDLPRRLVDAVLAAEDRRFFEHHGIDGRGVARALVANLRSGRVVQGGSTLTQQVIKNFFLTPARTWRRKATEAVMALLLEWRYSKLEILELYLNEIYFGQRGAMGIHGVREASRFYFGKEPRDLTLAETAMLAGLIRAPGKFAPTRDPERARSRRNQVLVTLRNDGKISEEELEEARTEPLPERLPSPEPVVAPYYVEFVQAELQGRHSAEDLVSQGFRIFTSLDVSLQLAAEKAVARGLERLEQARPEWRKREPADRLQAAVVAIQPSTGEIRAMVGGRSYAESQFDRATQARRQIGSLFKPIVALAAFEEEERESGGRFTPARRLEDAPFTWRYDGRSWTPANFADRYLGEVTMRDAIEHSLNAATARLAEDVGLPRILQLSTRLGLPKPKLAVPSVVLGTIEASPLEVAQAYAAISSLGFRTDALSIRSVHDAEGLPIERATLTAEQVVSPRVAHLVTSLLEGVVDRGTARGIREAGIRAPVAGKTGTTNDGRDAWFVGFVPDLLTVVWVGFDRGEPAGLTGSRAALPIWIDVMKEAIAARPATPFLVPPGIRTVEIDPASGGLATPGCRDRRTESFLDGSEPVAPCALHARAPEPPMASPSAPALSEEVGAPAR